MAPKPPSLHDRPSTIHQALERAALALRAGHLDEAERLAVDVLKSDRGNVLAAQIFGQSLLLQGRPNEAVDPLQRIARRSNQPAIQVLLARAFITVGRGEEALDELRRATARRPPYPLAFLELGDQLSKMGRFDEGVEVFETGLALTPDAAVLRIGLGYLHLNRNERTKAKSLFLQVRAAAPERHDVLVALANVLALDGEYSAAADLYRRALGLRPDDATTRTSLGKCLLEMGEREAGEATLRAATRGDSRRAGLAISALAGTPHGRFFLRPSAAAKFLSLEAS